ncbi:hypothetical protein RchiOBHm_Chr2g0143741 [Rosa chinensis]|uniref:Uncharacterized protein n=1 Tax=Rosa chinensis TaxID=74649 RepID=A0A2P6RY80_ROSCH|nr:hypothetical protein RchiOBHm_Chr2g0143741 [Rosa chinensis]
MSGFQLPQSICRNLTFGGKRWNPHSKQNQAGIYLPSSSNMDACSATYKQGI